MNKLHLIDKSFGHNPDGYCSDIQKSNLFIWDRSGNLNPKDNVVITDVCLNQYNPNYNCIAWLIEPIEIMPYHYTQIQTLTSHYKRIFTHDKMLLDLGEPYEFVPFGCCWITPSDQAIYEKSKLVSMIASSKTFAVGHRLRHEIIHKFGDKIDVYGSARQYIVNKITGLKDYYFSIVIENCKRDYWFTEKLIDAFRTGTIPIYWGCPSIGDFFDTRGMIIINNADDLNEVLGLLTKEKYDEMLPYVEENFKRAENYLLPDDWIYKKLTNE